MYPYLLPLHSLFRWLVLFSLLFAIYRGWSGMSGNRKFTSLDNKVRHWTATIAHVQFLIALGLYFVSPIMTYFMNNYSEAVHARQIRFFGMEHSIMMLLAIILITIGSARAKRATTDYMKFRMMFTWFLVGLIIILLSIPWPFSPMAQRPWFREF